ncbi:TetR/AcrR family transcriptional regulator [Pseudonocardia spinosispora]|uniref:TetR/AcrR family transcriptional regulator n=1 Tax=Pseudonocardia spinosispora TaxID=103441 RepID=UPI00048A5F52|nr:TetR family transcriptional regulator [Pseudonocardia spinosispora]
MRTSATGPSVRKLTLLESAYEYIQRRGLSDLSLRPLATEVGSSPRVLLFLFGSKHDLIREVLARARTDERRILNQLRRHDRPEPAGIERAAMELWTWLSEPVRRPLLALWAEAYARSVTASPGPTEGFAKDAVEEWLAALAAAQPADVRASVAGATQRTLILAVLRGALLDLLATDDLDRTTSAVHHHLAVFR